MDEICLIPTDATLQAIAPQIEQLYKVCFLFSTPTPGDKPNWSDKLDTSKSGLIHDVSDELVCDECKKKSRIEMVKCTHKKLTNPNKSILLRKRMLEAQTKEDVDYILTEHMGIKKKRETAYYPKEHIDAIFVTDGSDLYRYEEIDYLWVTCDPNAGGNCKTALIGGVKTIATREHPYGRIIITYIDNATTRTHDQFHITILDNCIDELHKTTRQGRLDYWIVMFIEAQKAWDADTLHVEIKRKCQHGSRAFEKIHVFYDQQKNKYHEFGSKDIRRGINVNSHRQNAMVDYISMALRERRIVVSEKATTRNEIGIIAMKIILRTQLYNFFHFEENKNSGWVGGRPRKNNDGKYDGEDDDVADSFHLIKWVHDVEALAHDVPILYEQLLIYQRTF